MTRGCVFQERNTRGVSTNVYLRKTSEKSEKTRSTNFLSERFGSCIYARGRYYHPTSTSQGTAAFNRMCKHDFDFYVPFLCLYILYTLFIFSLFCGRQGCFPLLLRIPQFGMRKSDLRSSFGTKCFVKLFLSFLQNMFLLNKRSFKVLNH